jgi:three-Cys-motif partner protein
VVTNPFFEEQDERSRVKAELVVDYFKAWSLIMAGQSQRIGYLDLYCGPGKYESGEESTPLLILRYALASPRLRQRLRLVFNDVNPDHVQRLQHEASALGAFSALRLQPRFLQGDVSLRFHNVMREECPTFTFLDPWGYKGITRAIIREYVVGFGCEVMFFFNYNRINAAIQNDLVEPHMQALFGSEQLHHSLRPSGSRVS